jgi:hypothetical protein
LTDVEANGAKNTAQLEDGKASRRDLAVRFLWCSGWTEPSIQYVAEPARVL